MQKLLIVFALAMSACGSQVLEQPLDPPKWPLGADEDHATGNMQKREPRSPLAPVLMPDDLADTDVPDTDAPNDADATDAPAPESP